MSGRGAVAVGNHLRLSLLATALFIPFGLMALLHAFQVNGLSAAGLDDRAKASAALARRWALAGVAAGLIVNPLLILAAWMA